TEQVADDHLTQGVEQNEQRLARAHQRAQLHRDLARRREQRCTELAPADLPEQHEAENPGDMKEPALPGHVAGAGPARRCSARVSTAFRASWTTRPNTASRTITASTPAASKRTCSRFMIAPRLAAAKNSSATIMPCTARTRPSRSPVT